MAGFNTRTLVGTGLMGLFLTFLGILVVLPYIKYLFPQISGFMNMTCEEGRTPCEEGYFCAQRTCVPISSKVDMSKVSPNTDF
jgi:hypothetical protein